MTTWLANTIGTPVECLKIGSEMEYMIWARQVMHAHGVTPILKDWTGDQPAAYVNDGRWAARCLMDTNTCIAHPGGSAEWPNPVAVCAECGTVYRPVFPANRELAEIVLLARPDVRQRHWFGDRDETPERLGHLIVENAENKWPKRRAIPSSGEVV